MGLFLASIILGIVPMVVYALIVWRLDRWEKEPFPLMLAAFFWGFIPSAIFALISQGLLGMPLEMSGREPTLMDELTQASIHAPVTEEFIKAFGVWLVIRIFHREVDSVLDGMIYGSMVGFGFSAIENILYFSGQPDPASLAMLFFLRAFIFGFLHAMFTALTGVGLALGKFTRFPLMKIGWPVLGLSAAMATHALHNYFATMGGESLLYAILGCALGVVSFAVMIGICLYHENKWIQIHLADEVDDGVIFAQQALDAAAYWKRSSFNIFSLGISGYFNRRRLLHRATKLAYRKQRITRRGNLPHLEVSVSKLREEVRNLSRLDPLVVSGMIVSGRRLPPPLPPRRTVPPPLPPRQ